jgi:hypothetical protein
MVFAQNNSKANDFTLPEVPEKRLDLLHLNQQLKPNEEEMRRK